MGEPVVEVALPETWGELVEQARSRNPADGVHVVPWGPAQLDHRVWLARSAAEQAAEDGRCGDQIAAIARAGIRYRLLDERQRAVFGVHDAARWTRGRTRTAPVTGYDLAVTGEAIAFELARAMDVVQDRAPEWERAVGAYVWLRWLTGADDAVTYPLW